MNITKFTQQDVNILLKIGTGMLKSINIPVTKEIAPTVHLINSRKKYGICRHYGDGFYQICLSKYTLGSSPKSIMSTILHELLHTCEDCDNHGLIWKRYAKRVNRHYNYDIRRTGSNDHTLADRANLIGPTAVALVCEKCHEIHLVSKYSKFALYPERCYCKICGGRVTRK